MSILRDFQHKAKQHGAPATVAIVVASILTFLLSWGTQSDLLRPLAFFVVDGSPSAPWTFLTYPFYSSPRDGVGFIWFVIALLWLWGIGGSLERDIGTKAFVGVYFAATLLGAISAWIGSVILGTAMILDSGLVPVSAVTVAWGTRNASAMVQLMLVLPITGRWIGWISAGLVVFTYGSLARNPMFGFIMALPLLAAYFYAAGRLPGFDRGVGGRSRKLDDKIPANRTPKYFEEVKKREKEREERERLRKLFENSLKDDESTGR